MNMRRTCLGWFSTTRLPKGTTSSINSTEIILSFFILAKGKFITRYNSATYVWMVHPSDLSLYEGLEKMFGALLIFERFLPRRNLISFSNVFLYRNFYEYIHLFLSWNSGLLRLAY